MTVALEQGGELRRHLRDVTHEAHVRLNRHPLLAGLTRPGYPQSQYLAVLVAYYHVYRALESRIQGWLSASGGDFDYSAREKWPWLVADLAWFGEVPELRHPPALAALPEVASDSDLVGVLYTLEGSTLGGQVISTHLAQHRGLSAIRGARFFAGYGAQTAAMWQQFWDWAGPRCDDAPRRESAGRAAIATFAYLESWLDHYAV